MTKYPFFYTLSPVISFEETFLFIIHICIISIKNSKQTFFIGIVIMHEAYNPTSSKWMKNSAAQNLRLVVYQASPRYIASVSFQLRSTCHGRKKIERSNTSRDDIKCISASRTWYRYVRIVLKIQCTRHCRDSDVDGKHYTLDVSRSGGFILCELTIAPNAFELRRIH